MLILQQFKGNNFHIVTLSFDVDKFFFFFFVFLGIAEKSCARLGPVMSASNWYSLRDVCFDPLREKIIQKTILHPTDSILCVISRPLAVYCP
jgi:hypothetical protein